RLLGEKVKLDIRCHTPLWNCFADARQLEQAIINLLVNARDAMEGEGALTLTLYMEKGRIIWEVADSGKGMDAETKEKAFTPFFTTKALGEGTGLGLAMVHGFVLQSGGEIELHSTLGKGTTVRILLPRVKPEQKASTEKQPAQNSSNILLVEDEKDVRTLAAMALSAAGFNVWQADCAEKAIEIYQQQKPDLLISDVVMPGMNGTELAQKLKQEQPELKIILISGYAEQDIGNVRFLPKPFSLKQLTGEAHAQLAVS
ncbi:MAG: ATP-binding protein, partial [Parvibaculales bacterium]